MMNPTYAVTIDLIAITRNFTIMMMDKLAMDVKEFDGSEQELETAALDLNEFNKDLQALMFGSDDRAWATVKNLFASGFTYMILGADEMNMLEEFEAQDKNYVVIVDGRRGNTLGTLVKGQLIW